MTLKDDFLKLRSREEYDKKRERFRTLSFDKDIEEHMKKIDPDYGRLVFDPAFPLKKKESK